jgi:hypothetical protein
MAGQTGRGEMRYWVILCLLLCGCTISKPDGLYVNYKLTVNNATVEQFCKAKGSGDIVELVRGGKVVYSKGVRK